MNHLRISLFGNLRITNENQGKDLKLTRTAQRLLAYLLLHGHSSHSREILANLFWGDQDEERAHNSFNTALWRLRSALEPEGVPPGTFIITTPEHTVHFNLKSDHWLDVAHFEESLSRGLRQPVHAIETKAAQELKEATQLYTNDLLVNFDDDWAIRERERLRLMHLKGLTCLMHYYKHHKSLEQSLDIGQHILALDPLREDVHREMMLLYLESGQQAMAARQYKHCREILEAELGIAPMAETQTLYAQITPLSNSSPLRYGTNIVPSNLQLALYQLRQAMQSYDKARENLEQSIKIVERSMNIEMKR